MTLSTHAIVGATVAQLFPTHPVVAFLGAFASHLAIDSLPHWDYKILSLEKNVGEPLKTDIAFGKYFLKDLTRIGTDALLGIILCIAIFQYFFDFFATSAPLYITLIGAVAGILPDPLAFVYWKTRSRLLLPLQQFHIWIHGKNIYPKVWIGLILQLALIMSVGLIVYLILQENGPLFV